MMIHRRHFLALAGAIAAASGITPLLAQDGPSTLDRIRSTKKLEDDTVASLERAVETFYGQFTTGDGESLQVNEPEAEAMDASERGQERVQVKRSS